MINVESIKAKLKIISQERGIELQNLFNKLGEERFLARLAVSSWANNLIFKGGSLLPHLVETSRRTRDIDFSIRDLDNTLNNLINIIQEVTAIDLKDGFVFRKPIGEVLKHSRLPYTGARIKIDFLLEKIGGSIWMDLALGDTVDPVKQKIEVLRYKGKPIVGRDISLLAYPPEFLFAEKFQTAILLGAANSRMKDFYDMLKLANSRSINMTSLKSALERTFKNRTTPLANCLEFSSEDVNVLDITWKGFLRKWDLDDVPEDFGVVVSNLNEFLGKIKIDKKQD
ncbi:MAG: nucleotidyl transferase AbiEii/AbiGii toxin family protein [Pseudomonadota bacterium]